MLQQFYNLLYNKFTTNGQKFATSQHLDMSRCWAVALWCGKYVVQQVVELLWAACPLVVLYNMYTALAGVRVVEFGSNGADSMYARSPGNGICRSVRLSNSIHVSCSLITGEL